VKIKPVIGIALDLNLESVSGIRIDDLIKRSLRKLYRELKQDFIFHLHNPKSDLYDVESNEINENYFSAELNDFTLPCPFKFQTVLTGLLDRVANDCDSPVLVIITNRYFEEQKSCYELMLRNNLKKDLNCNFVLVGVGDNYDKDSFSSLSSLSSLCDFVHLELDELEELNDTLLSSFILHLTHCDQFKPSNATLVALLDSNKKNMDKNVPTLDTAHYCATFDSSGGFNISGDVEVNADDDLCEQDKVHCEVGGVSLKAKGCAEVDVEVNADDDLCGKEGIVHSKGEMTLKTHDATDKVHCEVGEVSLKAKGCAEVDVVAKKSVKSMKRTTKKPTKKPTKKKVNKKSNNTSEEDK